MNLTPKKRRKKVDSSSSNISPCVVTSDTALSDASVDDDAYLDTTLFDMSTPVTSRCSHRQSICKLHAEDCSFCGCVGDDDRTIQVYLPKDDSLGDIRTQSQPNASSRNPSTTAVPTTLASKLMRVCYTNAASHHSMSATTLSAMAAGAKKRKRIDDVTIMVLQLKQ
jgi:hypothetical protein